jgi:hypothetical protein
MKKAMIIFGFGICVLQAQAQGIGSFFSQKATQKKYYLEQIAAMQVYLGYLKKGYNTVNNGLTTIHKIKNGEFGLHNDYYTSLKNVNPAFQSSPVVKEIYSIRAAISNEFSKLVKAAKDSGQFTPKELTYIKSVADNLNKEADHDMQQLSMAVTPGQLQLTDDERLKKIEEVNREVKDKYAFTQSFSKKTRWIADQRKLQKKSIDNLKRLHGQ